MKNIKRYLKIVGGSLVVLIAASGTLTSCQNNDNDIYDQDPIIRLREAKAKLKNHLTTESDNGWIATFRPDGGVMLGEFNLWFDFEDDFSVNIKSDFNLGDLNAQESEYNFTMLRTFALSFPLHNKVHDFTQGFYLDIDGKESLYNNRSDIEFLFNDYLANGDVETVGFMTNQKVVFRKATAEEKAFRFDDQWAVYNKLETMRNVTLIQDGRSKRLNFEPMPGMRAAYIGKIVSQNGQKSIDEVLTDTGAVTFAANLETDEVILKPALELENGLTIDKLIWIGSAYYGEADENNSILIRP